MKITPPKNFPIVLANLGKLDDRLLAAGEKGIKLGLEFTRTVVQREFLQGPRPRRLGEVTGRLRNSIAIDVKRSGKGVIGRIGSNVKYAKFHEFGFTGSVNVRAHTRHHEDKSAGGPSRSIKFIRDRAGNVAGQKRESVKQASARGVEFISQQVKAHTRNVKYQGRPFIRPALEKTQGRIKDAVMTEINKIAGEQKT